MSATPCTAKVFAPGIPIKAHPILEEIAKLV
jgi:hypothetical protein